MNSFLLGKLNIDAIEALHDPIVLVTFLVVAVLAVVVLAIPTYFKLWGYLWREWICTVDHKKIGIMYIILAIVMLVRGLADAALMRIQQAISVSGAEGFLPAHHFDQIFTAHGVILLFFMAVPFMYGLMNFVIPLQIGARDVAFPFLNSLSFWLLVAGAILINLSLFVGEFANTGWLSYPPVAGLELNPGVGVDYYLWCLQLAGLGTIMSVVNIIITIFKMRCPGMTLMKMPIFIWTCLASQIILAAITPVITVAFATLAADRYLDAHFFTNELGGNAMMYVNLVWIWGHPEVYVLVLPAFGCYSEVVPVFCRKKLFGYAGMVYASMVICFMSLLVWGHHFFTMGAGPDINAYFGIATMIIAIPTGAKIFNWLFTIYKGSLVFNAPMLLTIGFMCTFVTGGMTGVMLAIPPIDFVVHNSQWLVAHFHHTIIGGVVLGYLAGFAYWFPKAFGFKLIDAVGRVTAWCWIIGFYLAWMPIYVVGLMGGTRRRYYINEPGNEWFYYVAAIGMVVIVVGTLFVVVNLLFATIFRKKLVAGNDPWDGRTLEWSIPSPPPFYNFALEPHVEQVDDFWYKKQAGYVDERPYEDIHMPKNTPIGAIISLFALFLGFALVWHIWWLAVVGFVGMIVTFIVRCFQTDVDYWVSAAEVERIENKLRAKSV